MIPVIAPAVVVTDRHGRLSAGPCDLQEDSVSEEPEQDSRRAAIAAWLSAKAAELADQVPGQPKEAGTEVYVLHMPGGKTYIGQPRVAGPEPEAGQ